MTHRTVYMNMETGEITFDHMTAVKDFYNNGQSVLLYWEDKPEINMMWEVSKND